MFDIILDKAHTLCEAASGSLGLFDGEEFRAVAVRGQSESFADRLRQGIPVSSGPLTTRLREGEPVVHIRDLAELDDPAGRRAFEQSGNRTVLAVPLRKDDKLLGMIVADRQEVRPFSDKQIVLLQNFAAQAVIAMENARLLTETREALEQQTATAEILRVISGSPTNVQPTFDAIATNATTLCGAASGTVFRFDGSLIHLVASYNTSAREIDAIRRAFPLPPGRGSLTARAILSRAVAHVADLTTDPEYTQTSIAQSGLRATLSVFS